MKARWQLLAGLISALAGFSLAIYIWHPIIGSWWYITDDYRWPTILGPDKTLSFREFLANANPPDWYLGSKVNRPTYYFTTSLMMYLFGEHIIWWNLVRIAMMACSLAAIGWVAARASSIIPALALVTLLGFHSMWVDALPRLQSELFALFGLSMTAFFAWAITARREADGRRGSSVALLCLLTTFGLYATGAKENITVLMGSAAAVTLVASFIVPSRALSLYRIPAFLVLAWSGLISYCVYRGVVSSGTDLYGRKTFSGETLTYFARGITDGPVPVASALVALAAAIVALFLPNTAARTASRPLFLNAFLQFSIAAFAGFLMLFYRGSIPELNSRYQFPYALLPLVSVIVSTSILLKVFEILKWNRLSIHVVASALAIWLAHSGVNHPGSNYGFNIQGAKGYTRATFNFRERLEKLIQVAKASPSRPIVFLSFGFNDAEPLASVDTFLKANGCTNPTYLEMVGYSEETAKHPSELSLVRVTKGFYTSKRFLKTAELPPGIDPIRINFSSADLSNGAVANFWPLW